MKKNISFFLSWFDEMCFIMCLFFSNLIIHLFCRFLKNGPTCVVHTCVAWSVAFSFSSSGVGEHVGVDEKAGFP